MAVTLTISNAGVFKQTNQPGMITFWGTLVPSGSYSTGGDTVALNVANYTSSLAPIWVEFFGQAFAYRYIWIPAATPTVSSPGKFAVIDYTAAPAAQLAAGAYPAAVSDDVINVRITAFQR